MKQARLTKKLIDTLRPEGLEYTRWDGDLPGFGLRVRPSGAMSYIVSYRAGRGRKAPTRKLTLGHVGKLTPDEARQLARKHLGSVAHGCDPALDERKSQASISLAELSQAFLTLHVGPKRKRQTFESYTQVIANHILPTLGNIAAISLTRSQVVALHDRLRDHPSAANRAVAILSSIYTFAQRRQYVSLGHNPAQFLEKYKEVKRQRYLSSSELAKLGAAIREAETKGLEWHPKALGTTAKHIPSSVIARTVIDEYSAAAIRLLLFTGARLREILHLRWSEVDGERGLALLPDSKTGQKTLYLNAPAIAVLKGLSHGGTYVIAGPNPSAPRSDLKRPWRAVVLRAGLVGIRLHDLRHTHASFGVAAGLGLPIIGKLLGHSQPMTTARYAHLGDDPTTLASNQIANSIASALGETVAQTKAA